MSELQLDVDFGKPQSDLKLGGHAVFMPHCSIKFKLRPKVRFSTHESLFQLCPCRNSVHGTHKVMLDMYYSHLTGKA